MKKLDLATLAVDTRKVEFDFPGLDGFKITLAYQPRKAIQKIREKSQVQKFTDDGYPYQEVDSDLYLENLVKQAITGWKGFTIEHLSKLVLIDESQVEDMKEEISFDPEYAVFLLQNSERFDSWVTRILSKLDNFRP